MMVILRGDLHKIKFLYGEVRIRTYLTLKITYSKRYRDLAGLVFTVLQK
jgi:hypothetical protein